MPRQKAGRLAAKASAVQGNSKSALGKDLKAVADSMNPSPALSRARSKRWAAASAPVAAVATALPVFALLFGLSLASIATRRQLHPLFGSAATNYYHATCVAAIDLVVAPLAAYVLSLELSFAALASALWVLRSPRILSFMARDAGRFGPKLGPVVFQFAMLWPIRAGAVLSAIRAYLKFVERFSPRSGATSWIWYFLVPFALHGVSEYTDALAEGFLSSHPPCSEIRLSCGVLAAVGLVAAFTQRLRRSASDGDLEKPALPSPGRALNSIAIGASVVFALTPSLDICKPGLLAHHVEANAAGSGHTLLDRRVSVTGTVTVGEYALAPGGQTIRYLRCDHSLLGGLWIGPSREAVTTQAAENGEVLTGEEVDSRAVERAESIYSTFVLQEAVRFVERLPTAYRGGQQSALIIGLGAGVAARSLALHGVVVSIVEIDPAVYDFARKYFAVPEPGGGAHLEDARALLRAQRAAAGAGPRYDYIIHDVFTGGAVPELLFTVECWEDIRAVLRPDGVLAVNFAGELDSPASGLVFASLLWVFPFCRAYEDHASAESAFKNLVIFCAASGPPRFRAATRADALGSEHRYHLLSTFAANPVPLPGSETATSRPGPPLFDANATALAEAQVGSAVDHWSIMRAVLPDAVWAQY